jgi:hypothetical protein
VYVQKLYKRRDGKDFFVVVAIIVASLHIMNFVVQLVKGYPLTIISGCLDHKMYSINQTF